MILHYRTSADPRQEALLHTTLKANDCDFRRWLYTSLMIERSQDKAGFSGTHDFYLDFDLANSEPGYNYTDKQKLWELIRAENAEPTI